MIFKNETRLEKILYCAESNSLYMRVYRIVAWYLSFKGIFRPRILVSPDKVLRILKKSGLIIANIQQEVVNIWIFLQICLQMTWWWKNQATSQKSLGKLHALTSQSVERFCAGKQFFTTSYQIFTIIQTSF